MEGRSRGLALGSVVRAGVPDPAPLLKREAAANPVEDGGGRGLEGLHPRSRGLSPRKGTPEGRGKKRRGGKRQPFEGRRLPHRTRLNGDRVSPRVRGLFFTRMRLPGQEKRRR
ncbi:hypothetical protein EAI_09083 [Harpegnathos saltator]|uniref:Uncharacterized protein n=1 Tax=Harpegnathos saltator TaxID=610380 RepID=E2BQU4_HARSA|nr:hypothetical protein EAI_09083 [Harpegnathos saltator]